MCTALALVCFGLGVAEVRTHATPDMPARLAALQPSDPAGYFLLGEEAAGDRNRALTRTLCGLAYELARVRGDHQTAAAAALALGDLSASEPEARYLRAVAIMLDPRHAHASWMTPEPLESGDASAVEAGEAVVAAWLGRGHIVRERLRDDGVRRLIDESPELRRVASPREPSVWLFGLARDWPCPECRNNGWVTDNSGGKVRRELCPNCHGDPGPALTEKQLGALLRAQARLLAGGDQAGGLGTDADGGPPASDPNPAGVATMLGIDARRCVWRKGAWVVPGEG